MDSLFDQSMSRWETAMMTAIHARGNNQRNSPRTIPAFTIEAQDEAQ